MENTNVSSHWGGVFQCDMCGESHRVEECPYLQSPASRIEDAPVLSYARQTLPHNLELRNPSGAVSVVAKEEISKFTQFGPFIAPRSSHLNIHIKFPLKIVRKDGGVEYLDQTDENLCNWMCLVAVGTPQDRNLLACQVEDSIFYIVNTRVTPGTEIKVWYAPFYQCKVSAELEALGLGNLALEATTVTRKVNRELETLGLGNAVLAPSTLSGCIDCGGAVNSKPTKTVEKESVPVCEIPNTQGLHISKTLSRISISRGSITFTHVNKRVSEKQWQDSGNSLVTQKLPLSSGDKAKENFESMESGHTSPSCDNTSSHSSFEELQGKTGSSNLGHGTISVMAYDGSEVEKPPVLHVVWEETDKNNCKKLRCKKIEPAVAVAGQAVVSKLPLRSLGVKHNKPWICRWCSKVYTQALTFAQHLKGHLLWIIGRCSVCEVCGESFSSSQLLTRHQVIRHWNGMKKAALAGDQGNLQEVTVKLEEISDDEGSRDEDDQVHDVKNKSVENSSTQNDESGDDKKIRAIPTENDGTPFNCQICTRKFIKPEYLLRHLKKHTGDFTCGHCHKAFARKENLQKHLCPGQAGSTGVISCPLCSRTFHNATLFNRHYTRHKGDNRCIKCGRRFVRLNALECHMKNCTWEDPKDSLKCTECPKTFISPLLLGRHMAVHSNQYKCSTCSKHYSCQLTLDQHTPLCKQIHKIETVGGVECDECNEKFTKVDEFRYHYQNHTHPYQCVTCSQRFRARTGYEVHVCENAHRCDECGAMFRSIQNLNRHMAVHGKPPYSCPTCNFTYFRKESVLRHQCTMGIDSKPEETGTGRGKEFVCPICSVVLTTRYSLNTHLKGTHGSREERHLECPSCPKRFHRRDLLQEHMAVHSKASIPCPTCNKLFKTRKSLYVHDLLHRGIKKFACRYCNKTFHQKTNMLRHENSHKPVGVIHCQHCNKECLSTEDLEAHLLTHTAPGSGENQYEQDPEHAFNVEKDNLDKESVMHEFGLEGQQPCSLEEQDMMQRTTLMNNTSGSCLEEILDERQELAVDSDQAAVVVQLSPLEDKPVTSHPITAHSITAQSITAHSITTTDPSTNEGLVLCVYEDGKAAAVGEVQGGTEACQILSVEHLITASAADVGIGGVSDITGMEGITTVGAITGVGGITEVRSLAHVEGIGSVTSISSLTSNQANWHELQ